MEVDEDEVLFKNLNDLDDLSVEEVIKKVQNILHLSEREDELLHSLKIGFEYCVFKISPETMEDKLLRYICPAAEKIFKKKLKVLENYETTDCNALLDSCITIIEYFTAFFNNSFSKLKLSHIESWLLSSIRIMHFCFEHCKKSEKIYGSCYKDLASCLTALYKKCSSFIEKLLNVCSGDSFLEMPKNLPEVDGKETEILNELLIYLSKSGNILFDLDIKTMAKVWKGIVFLIEMNFIHIKNESFIDETIRNLCSRVNSNLNEILHMECQNPNLFKIVKLASFALKLTIKFCQVFSEFLENNYDLLLNIIINLLKCSFLVDNENVVTQLTIGIDPLVSLLIPDKKFVLTFAKVNGNFLSDENFNPEYCILCCLVCQKLVGSSINSRILWFNQKHNVLEWVFQSLPFCQLYIFKSINLPSILVLGKQKKNFKDLYEYILVTTSAYIMTMSHNDFIVVEKILIKSILQPNPLIALLAIDIWCLIARFSDSSLCFSQIRALSLVFSELKNDSLRIEKLYLRSLMQRLYVLLTENQKKIINEEFELSFFSDLWAADGSLTGTNDFLLLNSSQINSTFLSTIHPRSNYPPMSVNSCSSINDKLTLKVISLWKFNCKMFLNCCQNIKYLKVLCALAAFIAPEVSSENLCLVLNQVRKMIEFKEADIVLYTTWILNSLSTVRIPVNGLQRNVFELIADIFRSLLLTRNVLVKIKALETFYCFSHMTTHSDIITLTVQNSHDLKAEIAEYFKKNNTFCFSFSLDDFLQELCRAQYEHKCFLGRRSCKIFSSKMADVILKWKESGENLIKNVSELTESQKKEIVIECSQILSVLQ